MAVIEVVAEESSQLDDVIRLWRANRKTLGPYPKGAFIERVQAGQILAAVENGTVLGYALYYTSGRHSRVRLTHLCVDDAHRGKGLAKQLLDELRHRTRSHRGISLHCRRDYPAWHLWPRLGFVAISEKIGRGKDHHNLTCYRIEYQHETLFSSNDDEDDRMKVVIDANIFYDLDDPTRNGADETLGMTADWIQPLIQLCINDELLNEIHRNEDSDVRSDRMAKARQFDRLECNADDFLAAKDAVRALLDDPKTDRDESDQRHLARTIASDATVFVTRDEPVLKAADDIYDQHGLSIVRPAQLVGQFEELRNERDYQRARLAGTPLQFRRYNTEAAKLAEQFQAQTTGERKRELEEFFNTAFAHPDRFECHLAETGNGRPLALHVAERVSDDLMTVPVFRIANSVLNTRLAPTLARTLLSGIVQKALRSGIHVVQIHDPHLNPVATTALQLGGFVKGDGSWLKFSVMGTVTVEGACERVSEITSSAGLDESCVDHIIAAIGDISFRDDSTAVLEMEHLLWPGKLVGCDVANYIIPIRPRWASDLFDAGLAKSSLWGAETELALNPDSVYYRASRPPIRTDQGRILWYVSADDKIPGSMRIRACSQLEDVVTGSPKDLFRRFRRFGVYEWRHVLETAGSLEGSLMALQFSDTELFVNPITWDDTQAILRRSGIRSTFQSPTEITEDAFIELYRNGLTPTS